jgi:hypothetical protein
VQAPQQAVAGVQQLPSTGSSAGRQDGWLLPAGLLLIGLSAAFYAASWRMAHPAE